MPDDLSRHLGFRLGAAWRRVDRHFNRALEPLDLTHAHACQRTTVSGFAKSAPRV